MDKTTHDCKYDKAVNYTTINQNKAVNYTYGCNEWTTTHALQWMDNYTCTSTPEIIYAPTLHKNSIITMEGKLILWVTHPHAVTNTGALIIQGNKLYTYHYKKQTHNTRDIKEVGGLETDVKVLVKLSGYTGSTTKYIKARTICMCW